jgi:hypothetical protein
MEATAYNYAFAGDCAELDWDEDFTFIPQHSESKKYLKLAIATAGCALSVSTALPQYDKVLDLNSIEYIVDVVKAIEQDIQLPLESETSYWDFCKSWRFTKNKLVQDDNILTEEHTTSIGNLLKLSEIANDGIQMQKLPAYAEDLLQKVWQSELSDEPLIPGIK